MDPLLSALADPKRRRILDLLRAGERHVGDIVDALEVSQPMVSKHLRVLRDAGLVNVRADAQRRVYRLRAEPLRDLAEWLAPYRLQWGDRLDALGRELDRLAEAQAFAPSPPGGGEPGR